MSLIAYQIYLKSYILSKVTGNTQNPLEFAIFYFKYKSFFGISSLAIQFNSDKVGNTPHNM